MQSDASRSKPSRRSRAIGTSLAFAIGFGVGSLSGAAAAYGLIASDFRATAPAAAEVKVRVPVGGTIICTGDSLTYGEANPAVPFTGAPPTNGSDIPRSTPYPETLSDLLHGDAVVVNYGHPGDRVSDGADKIFAVDHADLIIAMYGTNDSNNSLRNGRVPIDIFKQNYQKFLNEAKKKSSQILILIPPARIYDDATLQVYRDATIAVAIENNIPYLDTRVALSNFTRPQTDGVHLTGAAYRAIATYVAGAIATTTK